ncbi:MAG: hypothetical protein KatS3mg087_0621 [Patescibacteria group bacterium]|nr:MAG: hypothetical protein KatS3mg087_0621 [Patescibacteria group bacterium]
MFFSIKNSSEGYPSYRIGGFSIKLVPKDKDFGYDSFVIVGVRSRLDITFFPFEVIKLSDYARIKRFLINSPGFQVEVFSRRDKGIGKSCLFLDSSLEN